MAGSAPADEGLSDGTAAYPESEKGGQRRITADELERMLAADKGKRDGRIAERLSGMELSERLSATRLSRYEASVPGPHDRQALLALAEGAAFLDLPAGDVPAMALPDDAAQSEICAGQSRHGGGIRSGGAGGQDLYLPAESCGCFAGTRIAMAQRCRVRAISLVSRDRACAAGIQPGALTSRN